LITSKNINPPAVTDVLLSIVDDPVVPSIPSVPPVNELVAGFPKSGPAIIAPAVNPPEPFTFTSIFVSVPSYGNRCNELVFCPVAIADEAEIVNVATPFATPKTTVPLKEFTPSPVAPLKDFTVNLLRPY
jgi:hypothetical protein